MQLRICFLVVGAMFLLGCGEPDALLVSDEAWITLNGSRGAVEKAFQRKDLDIEISVIPMKDLDTIRPALIEASGRNIVILSPLLSGYTDRLAPELPDITFVAFGSWEADNVFSITSDRSDVMETAGRMSAEWVAGLKEADKTVVAVFLRGTDKRDTEYARFIEGWNDAGCDCILELKSMRPDENPDELDSFLSLDLLERSVLGLFFAGKFNRRGIEYCASVSVPVVTENVPTGEALNAEYIFTIEESYLDSAVRALEVLQEQNNGLGSITMEASLVTGEHKPGY